MGPVQQPYARVNYIPQSGTKSLAIGQAEQIVHLKKFDYWSIVSKDAKSASKPNWILIDPLHYLSSRSDFGFNFIIK